MKAEQNVDMNNRGGGVKLNVEDVKLNVNINNRGGDVKLSVDIKNREEV